MILQSLKKICIACFLIVRNDEIYHRPNQSGSTTTLFTIDNRGYTSSCRCGRNSRGRDCGNNNNPGGSTGANRGSNTAKSGSRLNTDTRIDSPIVCKVYNKVGHYAHQCHNYSYEPDDISTTFSTWNFASEVENSTWISKRD